jgi:hypothetical protein
MVLLQLHLMTMFQFRHEFYIALYCWSITIFYIFNLLYLVLHPCLFQRNVRIYILTGEPIGPEVSRLAATTGKYRGLLGHESDGKGTLYIVLFGALL